MNLEQNTLRFFLGANTPQGFVSRFEQLADVDDGWRSFIIKGGPGCGKSTMIKKVALQIAQSGGDVEMIHCSSDADSLDAIIAPSIKLSLADGTSPHLLEPKFPGAFESVVDMTQCWDDDKLFECRDEIVSLTRSCSRCHEYCCRYLSAAGSLSADIYRVALDSVDTEKLSAYCTRLAQREFKTQKASQGKEKIRFLSAVTNKGVIKFTDTAKALAERIYIINDEFGAVSRLLLHTIRSKALAAGYDIISCYCPLGPYDKLEQLFIPSLKIGFMTSNRYHDFSLEIDPYRIINSQRFTFEEKFKVSKKRISFNRKAMSQMVLQAENLLAEAKSIHDELESYYIAAIDFKKVDALTNSIVKKVGNLSKALPK